MFALRLSYRMVMTTVIALSFTVCMTASADIIARGSGSSVKIMKALARAFKAKSHIEVTVEGGGSSKGAKACIAGEVQIGLLARDLKDAEKSAGLISHRYALDGVAVIVNLQNPANGTTMEELKAIYTGASETLGGGKVIPFNRPKVSGTRAVFQKKVLGKEGQFSENLGIKKPKPGVDIVRKSVTALYYTSAGADLETVKVLTVNGLLPTSENLRSGTYSMSRPLIMATKGQPTGEAKQFIDFIFSSEGKQIIQKKGFVVP